MRIRCDGNPKDDSVCLSCPYGKCVAEMTSGELAGLRKAERAMDAIRLAARMSEQYYGEPLVVAYSGGKDSDVLADLAVKSGASVEFEHSLTTVDAPETVYHVREVFRRLEGEGFKTAVIKPEMPMWQLIAKKGMPPTRIVRYCYQEYKESTTPNRIVATGVRKSESSGRKDRDEFEVVGKSKRSAIRHSLEHASEAYEDAQRMPESWDCQMITAAKEHKNLICNPIIGWTDNDVWDYIRGNGISYNPLYDRGYHRVGCIGCPMARRNLRMKEFADHPGYKRMYLKAFELMLDERRRSGRRCDWKTAQEVFDWWMEDPNVPGQMHEAGRRAT